MTIKFTTCGQAFDDPYTSHEVERILKNVATSFRNGENSGVIMDINGNKCGKWSFSDKD